MVVTAHINAVNMTAVYGEKINRRIDDRGSVCSTLGAPGLGVCAPDRLPDALGRRGQTNIGHPQRRQRIQDCVDHGGCRPHRAAFADTLYADGVRCARNRTSMPPEISL